MKDVTESNNQEVIIEIAHDNETGEDNLGDLDNTKQHLRFLSCFFRQKVGDIIVDDKENAVETIELLTRIEENVKGYQDTRF